jgi:hypothetical protein
MGINLPSDIAVDIRQPILGDSFSWAGVEPAAAKKVIVIHATASRASNEDGFTMADYHVNSNGWGGIGVHFVCTKDNYPGRPGQTPAGAHIQYVGDLLTYRAGVLGNNPGRVHIEISGLFTDGNGVPSEAQLRVVRRLIDFLLEPNNLLPSLNYHNQVDFHNHQAIPGGGTACPGWNNPQFGEWMGYLQGGAEPSWFGKPAAALPHPPAPSAPNVPSTPITEVHTSVNVTTDVLNVRRLPTIAAEIAGQFQRGQVEITGWTAGDSVTIEGRTSNIWLRSLNGNWCAQAGTDAHFGEDSLPTAPPSSPQVETPVETVDNEPEYEKTWLEDHTLGQKVVAVPLADVIDAAAGGKVVKQLPGGEPIADIAGYFKFGGREYIRTQYALDHGKWNGIALSDVKDYVPPVVIYPVDANNPPPTPINPTAPVDAIQPPSALPPPYEDPHDNVLDDVEPETPPTPGQATKITPNEADAWRKFVEIVISIVLIPLRYIGRLKRKGN